MGADHLFLTEPVVYQAAVGDASESGLIEIIEKRGNNHAQ